jgi:hypothetical protein
LGIPLTVVSLSSKVPRVLIGEHGSLAVITNRGGGELIQGIVRARQRKVVLLSTAAAVAVAVTFMASAIPSGAATTPTAQNVGVLAATAGCGRAPALTSGTHSLQSNGTTRSYILRLPDNYDNTRPYRLIFGFHWLGGNANSVVSRT